MATEMDPVFPSTPAWDVKIPKGVFTREAQLTAWSQEVAQGVAKRGFVTPKDYEVCSQCHQSPVVAKLMLVTTELAEAVEEARKMHDNPEQRKLAFEYEMADTFIRLMDLCGALNIDIGARIREKEEKNAARPYLHGKTC